MHTTSRILFFFSFILLFKVQASTIELSMNGTGLNGTAVQEYLFINHEGVLTLQTTALAGDCSDRAGTFTKNLSREEHKNLLALAKKMLQEQQSNAIKKKAISETTIRTMLTIEEDKSVQMQALHEVTPTRLAFNRALAYSQAKLLDLGSVQMSIKSLDMKKRILRVHFEKHGPKDFPIYFSKDASETFYMTNVKGIPISIKYAKPVASTKLTHKMPSLDIELLVGSTEVKPKQLYYFNRTILHHAPVEANRIIKGPLVELCHTFSY